MNVGIIGCGNIASLMAKTINMLANDEIKLYAVASRNIEKATGFKNKYGAILAYGSYEELVKDSNIDLVYIATPHSSHFEHIMLALNNGKNVLCEKPFTVNADEAIEAINLAKQKKVLLCEAMWTRFMPSRAIIGELICSDIIGNISYLSANLGYPMREVKRLNDPNLAGGALMDVGVYTLNFAVMCFGHGIERLETSCQMSNTGVDYTNAMTLYYSDRTCHLHSTMLALTDRNGYICGDKGYIFVENINNPQRIVAYSQNQILKDIKVPEQVTGYEYELLECLEAIKDGKIECKSMPHEETIFIMKLMDQIRKKWNLKYPMEK